MTQPTETDRIEARALSMLEQIEANPSAAVYVDGTIDLDATMDNVRRRWDSLWWNVSKESGTAVIVHPTVFDDRHSMTSEGASKAVPSHYTAEEWYAVRLKGWREENARRMRATPELCALVLMGYIEGRRIYADKLGRALGDFLTQTLVADQSAPSVQEMERFLVGELDADPRVARGAAERAWHWSNPRRHLKAIYDAWEHAPE